MKKIMLLLCCSLIPWIARGQAAYDWYYWFDSDDAVKKEGTSIGNSFSIITDASGLSQGFHTIHVQVVDTAGVYSPPKTEYFYHTTDRSVVALRYWFDNDMEHMQKVSASGFNYTIDVSSLEPGLHYIYCQIEDASGSVSDVVRSGFYRQIRPTAMTWTYWFDETESTKATVKYPGEAVMVDVSDLTDGFHTIHSQVQEITPSSVETRMFIKTPQTEGVGNMTCICTIDGNLVAQEEVPAQGGIMRWEMDVDSLDVGIHKAMFQAITPSGAASSIAERYFVRAITNKELGSMKCVYSLDNFKTSAQAGTLSNGLFHFDLDVSAMEDGLHRLAYMLVSENGVTTPQKTAFFWKTPLGGSGITQYDYWLNESKNVHSVTLDKRTNPFSLVKLLPVETEPIRSSCFQFEVKDGRPMLYAKNDFHIAFYDVTGRRVDESKQYVDYNVSAEVADIAELQSIQTFARPEEDGIKWFKFEAAPGDTIGFKLSQATTLQVFAPSGKEIYAASGDKSVVYGGAHTWEEGNYYVAVHDVTGSKPNVTLDYMHMDKYDVVDQDVRVVGNGGCSTITFQGNGFKNLYAVDFYTAQGDTIHSIDVGHESDSETTVTFDFTGAELGKYNAVFHFTEEDKTFANNITVEEAKAIELVTKVSYPSTFLRGTSVTYTVEITNKGNMTAYGLPMYTWIKCGNSDGISHIEYEGLNLKPLLDIVNIDSLSQDEITELEELNKLYGDSHHFYKFKILEKNGIDSIIVRSNYFYITLAPNETRTLHLLIQSTDLVSVEAYTPTNWPVFSYEPRTVRKNLRFASRSIKDQYCCISEKIDCALSIASNVLDMASAVSFVLGPDKAALVNTADCVVSIGNSVNKFTKIVACGNDDDLPADIVEGWGGAIESAYSAALSCVARKLSILGGKKYLKDAKFNGNLGNALSAIVAYMDISKSHSLVDLDCVSSFWEQKPNCPPNPGGGGGSSTPVNSLDPNDIYGYVAQSGSKHIGEDVVTLPYRIEFENDTTFATASAHTVIVKDTLDATKFDLASYQPTSITIGDKNVQLKGDKEFVTTVDMRPAINAIAQVEGKYDEEKGIATWKFTSLDPMTMEETDDVMQGFLPVNIDGNGIGEVAYNINLKTGLADGTEIRNRASITFDANDPILTPTWTNIIDALPPVSTIASAVREDSVAVITFSGDDNRSGVWKYDLYVQQGVGAPWIEAAKDVAPDSIVTYKVYDGIDYGFCVLATDSAGNVERKEMLREAELVTVVDGDANGDGVIDFVDATLVVNKYLDLPVFLNRDAADVNKDGRIDFQDATLIINMYLNSSVKARPRQRVSNKSLTQ